MAQLDGWRSSQAGFAPKRVQLGPVFTVGKRAEAKAGTASDELAGIKERKRGAVFPNPCSNDTKITEAIVRGAVMYPPGDVRVEEQSFSSAFPPLAMAPRTRQAASF